MIEGYCRPDAIPYGVKLEVIQKNPTANPFDLLPTCKTVLTLGTPVDLDKDLYVHGHFVGMFKGYDGINLLAEERVRELQAQGYTAVHTREVDVKACAIECGLGVRANNTMVVSKDYGTRLRFAVILTDWLPAKYSSKLDYNLCADCKVGCKCPHGCIGVNTFNRRLCYKRYLPIKARLLQGDYKMCSLCQDNCPYNQK